MGLGARSIEHRGERANGPKSPARGEAPGIHWSTVFRALDGRNMREEHGSVPFFI